MRSNTKEPLKHLVDLIMKDHFSNSDGNPPLELCNGMVESDDGMSANVVAAHRTIIEPPYGSRKYEIVHLYFLIVL